MGDRRSDGLWLAPPLASIALHGIAKDAAQDDAPRLIGCCGLPVDPVDDISRQADWDRDSHGRQCSAL